MNRTIRDVLLFGAGFAAGAYVMHTVFRTKYQEYADAQIDDVRDHYRKKEADLDAMIEEKAQQKSMEQLTESTAPSPTRKILRPTTPSRSSSRTSLVTSTTMRLAG